MLSSISYRTQSSGGGVLNPPKITPTGALTSSSSLTLLIHGYNCDAEAAQASYVRFLELENMIAPVSANIVGVFWPGDNWEGLFYYMQSLAHVKQVAPLLAQNIYNAAVSLGYLKVDIVAHSMGNRLVLETMDALIVLLNSKKAAGDFSAQGLIINRIVFMAAAVPTEYLEIEKQLRSAIEFFNGTMSLYSKADTVLHYGFPLGESLLREAFFPIALGRKKWINGSGLTPSLNQQENKGARHSDYWGANSKHTQQLNQAAAYVRSFIDLGSTPARNLSTRSITVKNSVQERTITKR